jgi:glutathione peroxidase
MTAPIYDFTVKTIKDTEQSLAEYKDKVMLIVNVASQCGFTPQYAGLEALYEKYKDRGLVVLGFPCNQFGGQEPGANADIAQFCETSFGVKFPLFDKIDVNGDAAHPLYRYLTEVRPGLMGTKAIKWNFTKFLVDRQGQVIDRYAPNTKPEELAPQIEKLL